MKKARLFASSVVLVLTLVACGSSDDSSDSERSWCSRLRR